MPPLFPPALVENVQVVLSANSSGTDSKVTGSTEKGVSLTLQPNTIGFVFGAIQDAAKHEQEVVVQLLDSDGINVEDSAKLDGTKSSPYHIVGNESNYAVVFGPFAEEKKIQVALYWIRPNARGLQPIDDDEIKEFEDEKLRTKVTLIPVFHEDKSKNSTMRTLVNVTRMAVKQTTLKTAAATLSFYKQDISASPINLIIYVKSLKKTFGGTGIFAQNAGSLSRWINGTLYYDDIKDLTGSYVYKVTTIKDSDGKIFCTINAKKVGGNSHFKFVASGDLDEDKEYPGTHSAELDNGFTGSEVWYDDIVLE